MRTQVERIRDIKINIEAAERYLAVREYERALFELSHAIAESKYAGYSLEPLDFLVGTVARDYLEDVRLAKYKDILLERVRKTLVVAKTGLERALGLI